MPTAPCDGLDTAFRSDVGRALEAGGVGAVYHHLAHGLHLVHDLHVEQPGDDQGDLQGLGIDLPGRLLIRLDQTGGVVGLVNETCAIPEPLLERRDRSRQARFSRVEDTGRTRNWTPPPPGVLWGSRRRACRRCRAAGESQCRISGLKHGSLTPESLRLPSIYLSETAGGLTLLTASLMSSDLTVFLLA